jgi:catechol 2,3-dioxygenase-like lactoylglutathione lyase family enzyme
MHSPGDVNEQLVIELYVRDFKVSCAFYQAFGFRMVRDEGDFAELQWEEEPILQVARFHGCRTRWTSSSLRDSFVGE